MRRALVLAVLLGVVGCGDPDAPFHPADLSAEGDLRVPDLSTPDLAQRSWQTQGVPVTTSLYGIAGTAGEVYVVGDQGVILHTADGGMSWRLDDSGTIAALFGVWTDGSTAIAVGYHGTLLRSIDHGATWQGSIFGSATLFGVGGTSVADADGGATAHLWAAGEAGTVLQSVDGGQTWAGTTIGSATKSLSGVWSSPVETFVVGDGGLFRTRDDGVSWTTLSGGAGNAVWASGSGQIVVRNGTFLSRSRDGGLSWEQIAHENEVGAFAAFPSGELWVASPQGKIDHYANDFEQLVVEDERDLAHPVRAMWGTFAGNLFVVGDNGFVAHWQ